jgi:hypothetical protein
MTAPSNLVALCHRHHRLHHSGGLQIDGDPERPDGLVFVDRFGRRVGVERVGVRWAEPPPPGERSTTPELVPAIRVTGTWRHPTGERLHTKWVDFVGRPPAPVPIPRE